MAESEVARFRREQALAEQSMRYMQSGMAITTRHDFITARMENIAATLQARKTEVGQEQEACAAMDALADEMAALPPEDETAQQVAEELKVNVRRIYKWIQSGELLATDLGTPGRHNYRIQRSDLEDFRQRRRTGQR